MTDTNQVIADGKVVAFHYTLQNDAGEVLDTSDGDEPMEYLHGAENIVPGLEREMAGKAPGAKFHADVSAEEGYGLREGPEPQPVGRDSFPEDAEIDVGMQFVVEDEDGELMPVWVAKVEDDQVYLDANHPLAGEALHFDVEVISIRDATADEMEHGHPHGAHAHEHDA